MKMKPNDHFFVYQELMHHSNHDNLNLWIVVHEINQDTTNPDPIFQGYAQKFLYDNEFDHDLKIAMQPLLRGQTRSVLFSSFVGVQYQISRH